MARASAAVRVRAMHPEDAGLYREFRLAALKRHPEAFTSSYAEERQRSTDWARERIAAADRPHDVVMGAFDATGSLVGTAGLAVPQRSQERHLGLLFGMAVAPELAGRGIGRALVTETVEHARQVGLLQVELTVSEDNVAATGLYRSCGFREWGRQERAVVVDGKAITKLHMVKMLDIEDER